jgi:hypothetical protein
MDGPGARVHRRRARDYAGPGVLVDGGEFLPEVQPDPAAPLAKPESIRVTRVQGTLRIEFDWLVRRGTQRGFRIAAGVVALGFLAGVLFGWDPRIALPIGLLLAYPNLTCGFDRSVITLREGRLRAVNRPFPWPLGGSVRPADVAQLHVQLERMGKEYDWSDESEYAGVMMARLRSGRVKKLLTDQDSGHHGVDRVLWVAQELQRELDSGRWTRP